MNTPKPVRAAGEVAARTAGRASSGILSAADTGDGPAVPPVWTAGELFDHVGQTWDAVAMRNTQGPAFDVDRAVCAAGHGDHGGWLISPDRMVVCGGGRRPCGQVLGPLGDILDGRRQDDLIRVIAGSMATRTRPAGKAAA